MDIGPERKRAVSIQAAGKPSDFRLEALLFFRVGRFVPHREPVTVVV